MTTFNPKDVQANVQRIGMALMAPAMLASEKLLDNYSSVAQAQLAAVADSATKWSGRGSELFSATSPDALFKLAETLGQDLSDAQKQAFETFGELTDKQLADGFAVADKSIETSTEVLRESLELMGHMTEAAFSALFQGMEKVQTAASTAA